MKQSYKIPYSINVRRWEAPISLSSQNGFGFKQQVKLSTILITVICAVVLPIFAFFQTPLGQGGFWGITLTLIGWEVLVFILVWPQDNGDDGYKWIIPTLNYWLNYNQRKISTRKDAPLMLVEETIQLSHIDPERGVIETVSGDVGFIYKVDGYASSMLFDTEMEQVIGAFERYLQLLPPNTAISIITQFMPLDLSSQIMSAEYRSSRQRSADLRAIAVYRERLLRDRIAVAFPTVTQWVFLSATDIHTLHEQAEWFERQVHSGMAKSAVRMNAEEATLLLASLYRP